jgi:hypothetical protein
MLLLYQTATAAADLKSASWLFSGCWPTALVATSGVMDFSFSGGGLGLAWSCTRAPRCEDHCECEQGVNSIKGCLEHLAQCPWDEGLAGNSRGAGTVQRRRDCQCTLPSLQPSSGSFASSLPRSTSGSESSLPSQVVRRALGVTSGPILPCSCGGQCGLWVPRRWLFRQEVGGGRSTSRVRQPLLTCRRTKQVVSPAL